MWVGGHAAQVREIVALADGWNGWGGDAERFAADVELVREVAPDATITWGGLVLTGDDDAAARGEGRDPLDRRRRARRRPGAHRRAARRVRRTSAREWVILGPIDSSEPRQRGQRWAKSARLLNP